MPLDKIMEDAGAPSQMKMKFSFLLILFFLATPVAAEEKQPTPKGEGFISAKVCGQCHTAIYEGWKESMHAQAVSDPVFYPIFLETSLKTGGKSNALCLSCHAPTTRLTKDWGLKNELTREGVTCDFCHSTRNVNLTSHGLSGFELAGDGAKMGPLKGVTSPFHPTAYSELFEESRFCAGCHEYTNERGVPILETWSEWAKSPQAGAGEACQKCHMPEIAGQVVSPKVKPTKEIYINSHEAAGGHSVDQLKKAVLVELGEISRDGEKVHATVNITNVGSGHKMPTGLPTRKLVLYFKAASGGTPIFNAERVFQKVLVNEKGEVITKDGDAFLNAHRVASDNRIEPKKKVEEHFDFYAPEDRPIDVTAEVYYLYQPRLIQETEMKVELGRGKKVIPAK